MRAESSSKKFCLKVSYKNLNYRIAVNVFGLGNVNAVSFNLLRVKDEKSHLISEKFLNTDNLSKSRMAKNVNHIIFFLQHIIQKMDDNNTVLEVKNVVY